MKTIVRVAAFSSVVLALSMPTSAFGGTPIDPNVGDHVYGTTGGVRYASDSQPFDLTDQYAGVAAGCGGPRWRTIGGGSAAGGAVSQAWLAATRPNDFTDVDTFGDDGWEAAGFGPDGASVTAYSICIRDGVLAYPVTTVPSSPSADRTGSIGCGAPRWHATDGGAFIATTGSWVTSSFPTDSGDPKVTPDDGWTGAVYDSVGGTGGFEVYGVCAAQVRLRYVKGKPATLTAGRTVVLRAACGPGEHVVGGGARVTGASGTARSVASAPYDGRDADHFPDDGWMSRVHSLSGGKRKVTPFAICLA
jgi:hypothetical protein